jgi:fucose 4-O-acetylase-like acetyltransferase
MCCEAMNRPGNSKGKRPAARRIALLLCVFFIVASVLSAAYILAHVNHHHDHYGPDGSCAVCAQLTAAVHTLKIISVVTACAALLFGGAFAALSVLRSAGLQAGFVTPVRLKVRLNN